jgi:hypothetical protein
MIDTRFQAGPQKMKRKQGDKKQKVKNELSIMQSELRKCNLNCKNNTQRKLSLELPVIRKAFSAVNRPSFCWFERDFGLNTAVRTGYFGHFPGAAVAASETTAATTTVTISVTAETSGISSVIKTHFCFTSAYSGYSIV